jgi:Protein of unknown function (DUF2971)
MIDEPAKLLFHYCPIRSFLKIAQSKSVRFNDLTLSNDFLEGKWVRNIFRICCSEGGLKDPDIERLLEKLDRFIEFVGGCGFCLSEEGDLLSQWRGYASEASGFSIGFNKEYLEKLAESQPSEKFGISLRHVEYDKLKQKEMISEVIKEILQHVKGGALFYPGGLLTSKEQEKIHEKALNSLHRSFARFLPYLYKIKNPAFKEEKEWRLSAIVLRGGLDDLGMLKDLDYQSRGDRIVPFFEVPLKPLNIEPFSKVILGPKNTTPIKIVKAVLDKNGFKNVHVSKSDASYR